MPPAVIFPRKREKQEVIEGAPEDSLVLVSGSGYMDSDLFLLAVTLIIVMLR